MELIFFREKNTYAKQKQLSCEWYISNILKKSEGMYVSGSNGKPLSELVFRDIYLHEYLMTWGDIFRYEI